MHQALKNLEGVAVRADDFLIFGKGNDEKEARNNHDNNLRALLNRCKEKNIKLDKEKIKLRQKELLYMAHGSHQLNSIQGNVKQWKQWRRLQKRSNSRDG